MVPEQPLPQVLPMPRPMPLPDAIPRVPDQPIPFEGLINPRPLDIRLLGTLPGYDDKDDKNDNEKMIKISQKYPLDNLTKQCIENQRNCLMRFKMK